MVDDDVVGMDGLRRHLIHSRHIVDFAESPETMTRLVRDNHYDVMILDIMLPYGLSLGRRETDSGMSTGMVLLKRLRAGAYGRNQSVRVVVYSARLVYPGLLAELSSLGVADEDIFWKPGRSGDIVRHLGTDTP